MLNEVQFVNMRAQVSTVKGQLQLVIIIQLSVAGCVYGDVEFHSVKSNYVEV